MIDNNVSLDLMEFVETQILPRYANFDQAHRLNHVNHVIKQSLALARKIGAEINMAYFRHKTEEMVLCRTDENYEGGSGRPQGFGITRSKKHLRQDCG